MRVKSLEISGFKSFARKSVFEFGASISAIVGPNGSGKSNVAEALRFVLGEQSLKSMRGKRTEDLIFNGSKSIERQNRAKVTIVFDNKDRTFPVDFDEVAIAREIHRDASSEYFLNSSSVRLKDVIELLASVHIGASGHHIISQGEADRILNASPKERRAMIEDALGLKIYHWRIAESEKKLVKTEENMRASESLRREIAPHIKFLKKQVEKIEQARSLREELLVLYREYLRREETYLKHTREILKVERETLEHELRTAEEGLRAADTMRAERPDEAFGAELLRARGEIGNMRRERDDLARKIGRMEGMIESEERRLRAPVETKDKMISARESELLAEDLYNELGHAESSEDYLYIKGVVSRVRVRVGKFLEHVRGGVISTGRSEENARELEGLRAEKDTLMEAGMALETRIGTAEGRVHVLEQEMEAKRRETTGAERTSFELKARKQEVALRLDMVRGRQEAFEREEVAFREELREGGILIGRVLLTYTDFVLDEAGALAENRIEQEQRRKKIERTKIRLEDTMGGGSGEDVMREYEETVARDEFLAKELEDLKKSAESLRALVRELEEALDVQFKEGIAKINAQFGNFFALMFGGGTASLQISYEKKKKRADTDIAEGPEDEEEPEEGIDVAVNLPHKKIRGLQMLSGGERALTSIALLFAVSQVNPPPFLVLDETDAALDEANSRKYGDMIENLSKYSQLVVITHNRETMSRAGIIYGVTMGSDAVSKLLSIKFEEAAQLAK
ncbi:MAG: Chromosome partition protein smc [Parcubacteria group bacterium GW2011_GWA1_47_8]|nr:MAG: Chromosome partition protein smc [Parcubacteria group bacterium GW2011_GWA1_47_8]KKW07116.1 MAG: Chromosome partition protein smc [Parcubacteria group bacterium GW2011_GWA2_49_16]